MPDFGMDKYENRTQNIKEQLEKMEKKLKDRCFTFIEGMPELEVISSGTVNKDKTDYATVDDFKKGISRENDADKITLDDLIEYIANNFEAGKMLAEDSVVGEQRKADIVALKKDLKDIRATFIDNLKRDAEELIAMQEELVKKNQKDIDQEKARAEELKKKVAILERKKTELMSKITLTNSNEESVKIQGQIDLNEYDLDKAKKELDGLTARNSSGKTIIEEHEEQQSDFIKKVRENKEVLFQILKENGIVLEEEQVTPTQTRTAVRARSTQGQAISQSSQTPVETVTQTEMDKKQIKCQSKQDAKNILANLMNNPTDSAEILDSMGYGDIAAMIQHLGVFDRMKLKNIIKNRATESGLTLDNINPENINFADEIKKVREFMKDYAKKTPKEIETFEEEMQKTKYACLLYSAKMGSFQRKFNEVFDSQHEQIKSLEGMLTSYHDKRVARDQQRFDLRNELRVVLGKKQITGAPKAQRGNTNKDSALNQRHVPSADGR